MLNAGNQPANFGIENIQAQAGVQALTVFSKDQLVSKAESRAMWSQIGIGLVGGLAAAGAASQRNTYRSTTYSRFGTFRTYASYPSLAGQLQANMLIDQTGGTIAAMQFQLDRTREALGDQIIQLTTVDPDDSYAGRIVVQKIKSQALPQDLQITVDWNGESYPFAFRLMKPGQGRPPVFTAITPAAAKPNRSLRPAPAARVVRVSRPGAMPWDPVEYVEAEAPVAREAVVPKQKRRPNGYCIATPTGGLRQGSNIPSC